MSEPVRDNPEPGAPADDSDQLDWDVERDGRMRDHAADPTPATEKLAG